MRKIIVNPAPAALPGAAPHRQRESLLVNGSRFFRRYIAAGHFHVRAAFGALQRLQAVGTGLHGAIVTPLVINRYVRVIPESERIELVKINRADNFLEFIGFFPVLMGTQIRKTKKISQELVGILPCNHNADFHSFNLLSFSRFFSKRYYTTHDQIFSRISSRENLDLTASHGFARIWPL